MIGIVTMVALLVALRIVLAIYMAEAAWVWWSTPSTDWSPASDDVRALPQPSIPSRDPSLAGSSPKGNPGLAFGPEAYPRLSLVGEEQGRTVVRLLIGRNGAVRRCDVVTSSGFGRLDRRTCLVAIRRVRFQPARDTRGDPVESLYTMPVRWVIPPS